jgi:PTH1 family peptidyl-tRNA hydrolase
MGFTQNQRFYCGELKYRMITIVAKFNVHSDKVDEFIKQAVAVTRETRKERGNLSYKIFQAREDKTKFTFVEEWLNDTAIEQHNNAKHFIAFLDAIKPLTDGDVQIEQLTKVPSIFY